MNTDQDYISRILLGQKDAFEPLVRKYHAAIRTFCFQMLRNEASADDAAQETFIKAFQAIKSFRADSSFKTWLFRISRNHCLDLLRAGRSQSTPVSLEDLPISAAPSISDTVAIPFESQEFLNTLLSRLAPDYREILLLREAQGLSYEEITQTLECSMDAVKARLRRARVEVFKILRHINGTKSVYVDKGGI